MSKISFKFQRMTSYIIVLLVATIITGSFLSFRSVTNQTIAAKCKTTVNVLRSDIQKEEQETATIADGLSASNLLLESASKGDISGIESSYTAVSKPEGFFAAVSGLSGNIIWKSADAIEKLNFYADGQRNTSTDLYSDGTDMYFQTTCPIYYSGSQVGFLLVGYNLSNTALVDNVKAQTENEVTIFIGDTRLNTTVLTESGERGVGTKLAESISTLVLSGKTYVGEATILGQKMSTKYEPLSNNGGKVLGILFAGQPSSESATLLRNVVFLLISISLIIGLIALFVFAKVTKQIVSNPVLAIKNKMLSVKSGRLDTPMEMFKRANNETTELADAVEDTVRTLEEYITDISAMLSSMASCDYSQSSEVNYLGQFSSIKAAMADIKSNTMDVIVNLQNASERIKNDSSGISSGACLLAQGTAEQAATIEELMASIATVSQHVSANAVDANNAAALSENVVKTMGDEEIAVDNMLVAISDIEEKSKQISKVIKAIEDIAFQTNILALNAAVEAARAGDAGKGFAVVAEEVRNLAINSANAASSTAVLIESTIASVNGGTRLAKSVADSMREVKSISGEANELIEKINQATAEQANALSQINIGMEQISAVVQQNSITAEESSISSQKLSEQSIQLQAIVSKFKI